MARKAADGGRRADPRSRPSRSTADVRPGKVVPGVLMFAEEHDADLIVVGASTRGPVAQRVLGDVSLELVRRSRRPVLVIAPPHTP